MAIDASIPLGGRPLSIADAANQGLAFGQNMQQQRALTQKTQMDAQEQEQANEIKAARLMHDTSVQLKSLPIEQRAAVAQQALPVLAKLGVDTSKIDTSNLTDDVLDQSINALKPFTVNMDQRIASASPTGSESIVDRNGTAYSQIKVFDPKTQKISLIETALGPTSSLTNRMGQTAETAAEQAIRLKREQEAIAANSALNVAAGQANIKLGTEQAMTPILAQQEASKKIGSGTATTSLDVIDLGEKAAPIIPRVERGIELLGKVDTGGFDAQMKAIADYTGADTADASELQSIFSEQLLSQMQSMKGLGAMSEGDRKAIESGIASWGKSAAGNKRILQNYLSVLKRQKNNALMEINRQGKDKFQGSYERIKGYTQEPSQPKAAPSAPKEVNWGDL